MRHSLPFSEWVTEVTLAIRPYLRTGESMELSRTTRNHLAEDWANGRAPEDVASSIGEGRHRNVHLERRASIHLPGPTRR